MKLLFRASGHGDVGKMGYFCVSSDFQCLSDDVKMDDGDKMIPTRMVMMRMLMADNDDDVEHAARSVCGLVI